MKKSTLYVGLLLVVVLSLALAACAGPTPAPGGDTGGDTGGGETGGGDTGGEDTGGETGGEDTGGETTPPEETPASVQEPVSSSVLLDPALATDADSLRVSGYVFETLVSIEGGEPVGILAAEWEEAEDGLAWTFTLRPGVSFHDGTPFNADAVLANFNRWHNPDDVLHGSGSYDAWVTAFGGFLGELDDQSNPASNFDGIEKVDNLTVLVHLFSRDADLLTKLSEVAFAMSSPDAMSLGGSAYGTMDGLPSGTGPYLVVTWDDGKLVLQPNPNYWGDVPVEALEFPLQ